MEPIDPAFPEDDDARAAPAGCDIGTLYRLFRRVGVSQRQIAQLTGQSQSEVSEIIKGRQVRDMRGARTHRRRARHIPSADGPELR